MNLREMNQEIARLERVLQNGMADAEERKEARAQLIELQASRKDYIYRNMANPSSDVWINQ